MRINTQIWQQLFDLIVRFHIHHCISQNTWWKEQNVSKYEQEIPQSQTAGQPMLPWEGKQNTDNHMGGSRGGDRGSGPPWKFTKIKGFLAILVRSPWKSQSYQASIQCWAIIGTPAKRRLMAFRWWTDDGPLIVVFGSSLPSSITKKRCQSWTPSDKTFWIRAWATTQYKESNQLQQQYCCWTWKGIKENTTQ